MTGTPNITPAMVEAACETMHKHRWRPTTEDGKNNARQEMRRALEAALSHPDFSPYPKPQPIEKALEWHRTMFCGPDLKWCVGHVQPRSDGGRDYIVTGMRNTAAKGYLLTHWMECPPAPEGDE